jgi:hypothetical protein
MTNLRRAITALVLHAAAVAAVGAALLLDAAAEPAPAAPAKPEPGKTRLEDIPDIAFYLAKGDPHSCGHDCDQWIAADGKIDLAAPQRLRALLAKIGKRRLPIFFHSPGGSVVGSLELGRLIRQQKLVAGVARTIPSGCDRDNLRDKACKALKRSGTELKSEFDTDLTLCNSGCVYALLGGTVRLVPPGVKLGIHDTGLDPTKTLPRDVSWSRMKRAGHERILDYVREVGFDRALAEAAFAVPYESVRLLDRDELVRFGIDRRELGETAWHFAEKPKASISKRLFFRTDGGDHARYRIGLVRMSCGPGQNISLELAHERESAEGYAGVLLDMSGGRRILPYLTRTSHFQVNSTSLSREAFDLVAHGPDIKISGLDLGEKEGSPRSLTLSMDGFSEASVKLRKSCDDAAPTVAAPAVAAPTVAAPTVAASTVAAPTAAAPIAAAPIAGAPGIWSIGKARDPKYNDNPNCRPGGDILRCLQGRLWVGPEVPAHVAIAQLKAEPKPSGGGASSPGRTVPRAVPIDHKLPIDFFGPVNPDCSSEGLATARVPMQPQHGTITVENGPGYTNYAPDSQRYECNKRSSEGIHVYYEPHPGFAGSDSATVEFLTTSGQEIKRQYAITVGGDPSKLSAAEAARVVPIDQKRRIDFLSVINPDCSVAGMPIVRVVDEPRNGKLALEKDAGFSNYLATDQRYECNKRRSDGVAVTYEPDPGFTGADSVTVHIITPRGTEVKRHYSIEVK